MKKIGFIDYFLDEWHANNYPKFLKDAVGDKFQIAYAYGEIDSPRDGGKTNREWADTFGVELLGSPEEVVEKSDYIIVLSPDNPERHWDLCQAPLKSGKRVYVDKTFALSKKVAQDLADLAAANNTPFFSSSALRFADELKDVKRDGIAFINSRGPGDFDTYGIHQIEPIVVLMGSKVESVMAVGAGKHQTIVIRFAGGRSAVMSHYGWSGIDFNLTVSYEDGSTTPVTSMSNTFPNFITEMCNFFDTGVVNVDPAETVSIMGIIEAGNKAIANPGVWINV